MNEPYAGSPLEGLSGNVPEGDLALVLGPQGVGKTAFLVHAALGTIMRGEQVLHVTLLATTDHVRAHYDEFLRILRERDDVAADPASSGVAIRAERQRMIHSTRGRPLSMERVNAHLDILAEVGDFTPTLLVVDGLLGDDPELAVLLRELRALAESRNIRCWASLHSETPLASDLFATAAVVVRLVPADDEGEAPEGAQLRLQPVHGPAGGEPLPTVLDAATLFAVEGARPQDDAAAAAVTANDCTLYTGGAAGTEVAFGEAAARYGVREVAFTFEGHRQERTAGRHELSPRELAMGDVSLSYVSKRLHRSYHDRGGLIRGVLQTLWHMVSRSHQVFVVGAILPDGTVKGGTGWGVELARMWSRDLWVYDQPEGRWCHWEHGSWVIGEPRITSAHLCGTGTRKVTDKGLAAIEALFRESFPP